MCKLSMSYWLCIFYRTKYVEINLILSWSDKVDGVCSHSEGLFMIRKSHHLTHF